MISEATVEQVTLELFAGLGYSTAYGPDTNPDAPGAERGHFTDVVLTERLKNAIHRLNPKLPEPAKEDALRKVLRVASPSLTRTNRAFHHMLRDGVPVEYARRDGSIAGDFARLADFSDPDANDWLAVNQFLVVEGHRSRRADVVVFLNGLPVGLVELKNAVDEDATIWSAYQQLQTYKTDIPSLLQYNEVLVISDGLQARVGSITSNQEWFKVWRTVETAPKSGDTQPFSPRGSGAKQRQQVWRTVETATKSGDRQPFSPKASRAKQRQSAAKKESVPIFRHRLNDSEALRSATKPRTDALGLAESGELPRERGEGCAPNRIGIGGSDSGGVREAALSGPVAALHCV